jgi:hypothetical protein
MPSIPIHTEAHTIRKTFGRFFPIFLSQPAYSILINLVAFTVSDFPLLALMLTR